MLHLRLFGRQTCGQALGSGRSSYQLIGKECSHRIFIIGDTMRYSILRAFSLAFACGVVLSGILAISNHAWGGEKRQGGQLDAFHADKGIQCADCHGAAKPREIVSMAKCLECHDTAELANKTEAVKPTNPHRNRHYSTEADCNLCHHQHKKSENFCLPCHGRFEFAVP